MFAYCNNNPVNACDKNGKAPDTFAGWVGEELGKLFYEWLTGDDHPSHQSESDNRTVTEKQNEQIGQAGNALLDSFMRWCNHQEEAQYMEAQLMSNVTPRIIVAGLKKGAEAALVVGSAAEISKRMKGSGQGYNSYDVAAEFIVGFVMGAGNEIRKIFKEIFE